MHNFIKKCRTHKQSKFFKEQSSRTCCLNSNRYLLYLNCMHWQLKNEATIWQDHTLHFIIYHWQMQQVLYVLYLHTNCYLIIFSWGWVGQFLGAIISGENRACPTKKVCWSSSFHTATHALGTQKHRIKFLTFFVAVTTFPTFGI